MVRRKIQIFENIVLDPEKIDGKVDFEVLFSNDNPVEIEIGSGKGTFLVNQGRHFENVNYIGIEWASKYYKYAVDRLGRWNLRNVKMLRTDAAVFIPERIPATSVSGYHIYFPDPWPKKRHHKRRFVCRDNLVMLRETLKKNGWVNIATDHEQYFEWMNEHIDMCGDAFKRIEYKYPVGAESGEMAGTNFERKYLREGREIFTVAIEKVGD